jgi:hypothetical protein
MRREEITSPASPQTISEWCRGCGGSAPANGQGQEQGPVWLGVGGGRRGLMDGPLQTQGLQPIHRSEIARRTRLRPPATYSDSTPLDERPPLTSEPLAAQRAANKGSRRLPSHNAPPTPDQQTSPTPTQVVKP